MFSKRVLTAASFALLLATAAPSTILASSHRAEVRYKTFANCTAMHKVYRHGVGKPGAVDHVSGGGAKVKNFYVSLGLYNANKGSDRDHDGIACEAH